MNSDQNFVPCSIKSFELKDQQNWLSQLQKTGAVVIKSVLNSDQVSKSIDLFWEWIQALQSGVKRNDSSTWEHSSWPGMRDLGFFATYGGCHTKASWFIRTHPNVRRAFATIWKTEDLISSFDVFIGWKPWWVNPKWKPHAENLHCDQNPFFKKGLHCVQGMVPLKRVRKNEVGGLMVVPNTNNDKVQQQLCKTYPGLSGTSSDWVQLFDNHPYVSGQKGVLIECDAGDLILWDSRTIHGGKVIQPNNEFKEKNVNDFVRLAMTVTMVPRSSASQIVLNKRKVAFEQKIGLTHWPNEYNKSGMGAFLQGVSTNDIAYDWPKLEGEIEKLV